MDGMEAALLNVIQRLKTVNYNEVISEVRGYDEKAQEMHEKMLRIHSEISEIMKEVDKLRLKESEQHKTIKLNAEEIANLKANLEVQQGNLATLPDEMKEYKGTYWPDFSREAELTKKVCDNLMDHFGFKIEVDHVEADVWRAKFEFLEGGEIILDFDILEKVFNLQSMTPIHPNFDDLRTYLYETQDISGFMCHARKYFLSKEPHLSCNS